ncbi:alpha-1,3-rhamnosyl/mannosyltransferase [Chromohalobacter canadensis]|uniref:Alpha-1,3-rhamnosyl/mannosyltransferase n=1 Tax=Chromohalobacter canadensis TaxID=141389 RepID=A0A285VFQ7_9GAMM|nr:glycosyltransferase family 1 protein [Chromohalobacter canadensis]SOC52879.1 alpha-1,3-rhamnosyl/mannosyltransferase [Chromohalobacter canadensis]
MKVIVNLQPLLAPLTGVGHYTREITRELVRRQSTEASFQLESLHGIAGTHIDSLHASYPLLAEKVSSNAHGDTAVSARAVSRRHSAWRFARRYLRNPVTRALYRQALTQRLRLHTWRHPSLRNAIYWEPNFVSLPWSGRSVVTVHDLSHMRYPEFHPRERVDFFAQGLPQSLARASRIHVVSRFTADELQSLFDIDPARIDIVPPGVSERFYAVEPAQRERVRQRHALPARYCLSVGTLEPRKNLTTLIDAFLSLPTARQHACPLVLVGMPGWGAQRLSTAAQRALEDGRLRRLGYVDDDELPALYANATLFAYVSRYEGFGMPVIEAMAAGTPVITADATATREVAGDAALTVPPDDIGAIRDALDTLMNDPDQADRLRRAGYQRARMFSWPRSTDALLESFRLV